MVRTPSSVDATGRQRRPVRYTADHRTYRLHRADRGTRIAVRITADRLGHVNAHSTSRSGHIRR